MRNLVQLPLLLPGLAAAFLGFLPAAPVLAQTAQDSVKIAVHVQVTPQKSTGVCTNDSPNGRGIPCSQYTTAWPVGQGGNLYLVAVNPDPAGVSGLSFGIEYGAGTGSGLRLIDWTLCASGIEFPSNFWPASGEGNRITWLLTQCPKVTIGSDGIHSVAGVFYLYAYSADLFRVTRHRLLQYNPRLPEYVTCDDPSIILGVPLSNLGEVAFGGGTGFTPCNAPPGPRIQASRVVLAFPPLTVGDAVFVDFDIINIGDADLQVQEIRSPSAELTIQPGILPALGPGEQGQITATLAPRVETRISDPIRILSNSVTGDYLINVQTTIRDLTAQVELLTSEPQVPLGEALTVLVTPGDSVNVSGGTLYYRPVLPTLPAFTADPLDQLQARLVGVVPGAAVAESGVEYYVEIVNGPVSRTFPPGAPAAGTYVQAVQPPTGYVPLPIPSSELGYLAGRSIRVDVDLEQGTVLDPDAPSFLHYRRGGEVAWQSAPLEGPPLRPGTLIPADFVTARGVEYRVEVHTLTRDFVETDPRSLSVTVDNLLEPAISPHERYRMISTPLDFGEQSVTVLDLVQDELGAHDRSRWRAFRRVSSGDYVEFVPHSAQENLFELQPGRAFWLIASRNYRLSSAPFLGKSTPLAGHEIVVDPGWNQVANPFSFPVSWDQVSVDGLASGDQDLVEPPRHYRPQIEDYEPLPSTVLAPFEGYWVRNAGPAPAVLSFPPVEAVQSAASPTAARAGVSPAEASPAPGSGPGDSGFSIHVLAASGRARDGTAVLGTAAGASEAWDRSDLSDPPFPPGNALTVYFPHPDWGRHRGTYCVDLRPCPPGAPPPQGTGWTWGFDIAKTFALEGSPDPVILEFSGTGGVPASYELWLEDRTLDRRQDLRRNPAYTAYVAERPVLNREAARFRVVIGDAAYLRHEAASERIPEATALFQNYPNPLRGGTVIRYDLARGGRVRIGIYDVRGSLVETVEDTDREPGTYEVYWTGTTAAGESAPPGVYFFRLRAPGFSETRKLIRIR